MDVDIGEQADLVEDVVLDRLVRAKDDDVRLDADPAQLLDRVLGRLGLHLGRRSGSQVTWTYRTFRRPTSLRIWRMASRNGQGLDVAHRPADLDHDHAVLREAAGGHAAGALPGDPRDPLLDLVGDVRMTCTVPPR